MESFIEIFKDFVFLNCTLEFKKKIINLHSKNIFSKLLMSMTPIIVDEFIKFLDENRMIERSDFFETKRASKLVKDLRSQSLKIQSSISSESEDAIKRMGINFEVYFYDLIITVDQHENLHDINFENSIMNFEDNLPTHESLFSVMRQTLSVFLTNYGLNYDEYIYNDSLNDFYLNESSKFEDKYKLEEFSYSTKLLFTSSFSDELTIKDKIFILFNYRTICSCLILPTILCPSFIVGSNEINPNDTIFKYFAINIEKIGQELMAMKTTFSKKLLHLINENIPDTAFYSLNRKLRNNLHYSNISNISNEDMDLIKSCQKKYINTCLNFINSYINISLTDEVRSMTLYTKLAYEKGISSEDLINNHEQYYTSFIKTGSINIIDPKEGTFQK